MHARGERFGRIAFTHRQAVLDHRRAGIERGRHEVHRRTVRAIAVVEHAAMRAEPGIQRQQRRMEVQHALREWRQELGAQDSHEAGEHDQVRRFCADELGERRVVGVALGAPNDR